MKNIKQDIREIVLVTKASEEVRQRFLDRLDEDNLTRDENAESHYCAYFPGIDFEHKKVFIGHHKKADWWLFNGGHIDKGELPIETVRRETGEEWGSGVKKMLAEQLEDIKPSFLTVTEINSERVKCREHLDIWYFVSLNINNFEPDEKLMAKEFYSWGWKTIDEAMNLIENENENTKLALREIEKLF